MTANAARDNPDRVLLRNVSWDAYECLLKNYENSSAPRLTYDRGTLEIMSPLVKHEETNRALSTLVETVLEVWDWHYRNLGSATFKREDRDRGFEPDTCFYIQSVASIADKEEIDLAGGDPAPDLIIEVDLTHSSLPRFAIFADLGVREVWRYADDAVTIHLLDGDHYRESTDSQALPCLTAADLNRFLADSRTLRRAAWQRSLRAWATAHQPNA